MNRAPADWRTPLAAGLWVITVLFTLAGVLLSIVSGVLSADHVVSLLWLAMATMGAVISIRVPGNPIGWLLLGSGLLFAVGTLAAGYADLALLAGRGPRTAGTMSVWLSHVVWAPATLVPLTLVLLLFPHGRLLSRRWRPFLWSAVLGIASTAALVGLSPDLQGLVPRWPVANPLAREEGSPVLAVLGTGFVLVVLAMIGAGLTVLVRFQRASGLEKQQLKWMVYGGALAVPVWIVFGVVFDETTIGGIGTTVAFTLFIASIGVAVLRYRLYDIDRLVSRTVSYAVVAGLLGSVFGAIAVGLPQLLGMPSDNQMLVAVATLAAAALFNPLRRRVQDRVDRRFSRMRYDTEQEIERFANRLRTELDLGDLTGEVLEVVTTTMQPARAGVWIRSIR